MAIADLHDIAKRIHEMQQIARGRSNPAEEEIDALCHATIQIVRELDDMDDRLRALERGTKNSN
jgi:hypothetical protein